jgi:p-aminobenzoyl-glutamate transporter AbgT
MDCISGAENADNSPVFDRSGEATGQAQAAYRIGDATTNIITP